MFAQQPGDLDSTFGINGRVTLAIGTSNSHAASMAMQSNGKIVVAGSARGGIPTGEDFALARFNQNGTPDTSFGSDGIVTTAVAIFREDDAAKAVAIQPDGKIIAAGYAESSWGDKRFALVRYHPDGTLDNSFGSGGEVTTIMSGGDESHLSTIALQPDGKIIAVGRVYRYFAIARYKTNGSLDSTFGTNGKVFTEFLQSVSWANSTVIQPDGKIIVAGTVLSTTSHNDFALARYHADGSLDSTFGSNGFQYTDIGGSHDQAYSVALQADGKIVLAGDVIEKSSRDSLIDLIINLLGARVEVKTGIGKLA